MRSAVPSSTASSAVGGGAGGYGAPVQPKSHNFTFPYTNDGADSHVAAPFSSSARPHVDPYAADAYVQPYYPPSTPAPAAAAAAAVGRQADLVASPTRNSDFVFDHHHPLSATVADTPPQQQQQQQQPPYGGRYVRAGSSATTTASVAAAAAGPMAAAAAPSVSSMGRYSVGSYGANGTTATATLGGPKAAAAESVVSLDSAGVAQFERLMNRAAAYGNRVAPFADPNGSHRPTVGGAGRGPSSSSRHRSTSQSAASYANNNNNGPRGFSAAGESRSLSPETHITTHYTAAGGYGQGDSYPPSHLNLSGGGNRSGSAAHSTANQHGNAKRGISVNQNNNVPPGLLHLPSSAAVPSMATPPHHLTGAELQGLPVLQTPAHSGTSYGGATGKGGSPSSRQQQLHYNNHQTAFAAGQQQQGLQVSSPLPSTAVPRVSPTRDDGPSSLLSSSSAAFAAEEAKERERRDNEMRRAALQEQQRRAAEEAAAAVAEVERDRAARQKREWEEKAARDNAREEQQQQQEKAAMRRDLESLREQQQQQQSDLDQLLALRPSEVTAALQRNLAAGGGVNGGDTPRSPTDASGPNSTAPPSTSHGGKEVKQQQVANYSVAFDEGGVAPSSSTSLGATAAALRGLQRENEWLRERLGTLAEHYEAELDVKAAQLEKAVREGRKLRKRLDKEVAMVGGLTVADLRHSNERLSAQLARMGSNGGAGAALALLPPPTTASSSTADAYQLFALQQQQSITSTASAGAQPSDVFVANSEPFKRMAAEKDGEIGRLRGIAQRREREEAALQRQVAALAKEVAALKDERDSERRALAREADQVSSGDEGNPHSRPRLGPKSASNGVRIRSASSAVVGNGNGADELIIAPDATPPAPAPTTADFSLASPPTALELQQQQKATVDEEVYRQQQQRVFECEAAMEALVREVEALDGRLRDQIRRADDDRTALQRRLEAQQSQFNVERLECDRVVHALSAKLEELARENSAMRRRMQQTQHQQTQPLQIQQGQQQQQQQLIAPTTQASASLSGAVVGGGVATRQQGFFAPASPAATALAAAEGGVAYQ